MRSVKISVVIPTYNAAHLLVDAIDSVLAQTVRPDEIIVIDDGSIDDTSGAVARYGDRIRYAIQKNAGASAARNHGVRLAEGEYIAFLDADDIWHPRRLEFQLKALEKRPDLGLLGCLVFDWPADSMPQFNEADAERIVLIPWEELVIKTRIATTSSILRKSLFDQLGGFDTDLKSTEDRDLWVRIGEVAPVGYIPAAMVGMRKIEGSLSRQTHAVRHNMLKMLRKVDARGLWQGRPLLRCKAYSYAYFATAYLDHVQKNYLTAFLYMFKSILVYPLPYRRDEVRTSFVRPKSLVLYFLRILGLARPEAQTYSGRLNSAVSTDPEQVVAQPASVSASDAAAGIH